MKPDAAAAGTIDHLLEHCGSLTAGERCVLVCDRTTYELAGWFADRARRITDFVELTTIPTLEQHGQEPTAEVADRMADANLILCLTSFSLAHSQARIVAGRNGARFLSLPSYSTELLSSPAVTADFRALTDNVRRVASAFTEGERVDVTADAGTNVRLDVSGRIGNACPGWVEYPGDLGSPPDVEANISPVEDASHGVLVVDGSVTCPEIGVLNQPLYLHIEGGRVRKIEGGLEQHRAFLERTFECQASRRRVLAECGVGLNPLATLTGNMLTDEGAAGCVHFGFGSNYTVGGQNEVDFHLDFVIRDAAIAVDGQPLIIVD